MRILHTAALLAILHCTCTCANIQNYNYYWSTNNCVVHAKNIWNYDAQQTHYSTWFVYKFTSTAVQSPLSTLLHALESCTAHDQFHVCRLRTLADGIRSALEFSLFETADGVGTPIYRFNRIERARSSYCIPRRFYTVCRIFCATRISSLRPVENSVCCVFVACD